VTKEYSPFTPGIPVPVEFFVGRNAEVKKLLASVKKSKELKTLERIFVTGERGIGKSSLCKFAIRLAEKDENVLGLHVFLGGVTTMEEMIRKIFERLLNDSIDRPWFDSIKSYLGNRVKQVGMFGITVEFDASNKELKKAVGDFVPALMNLIKHLKKQKSTILLVLDDLNGLANKEHFANWLKSIVDEIGSLREPLPLILVLVGLPDRRNQLVTLQPSLDRVFDIIKINRFDEDETIRFYKNAFAKVGVKVTEDAHNILWRFSGGHPVFMHEIGDTVFQVDKDNVIDEEDAVNGIWLAADIIGNKYIEPNVLSAIKSKKYREILNKIAKGPLGYLFSRKDAVDRLSSEEIKVFDNFIQRMKKLNVIQSATERGHGYYEFTSELYYLFFWMQARAK